MRIDGMRDAPRAYGNHGVLMTLVGKKIAANSREIGTRTGKEEYYGEFLAVFNHLGRAQQATHGGTELWAAKESNEFKLRLDVPMNKLAHIKADSVGKTL